MNPFVPDFILQSDAQGRTAGSFEAAALFVDIAGFTPLTERLLAHGKEGAEALAGALRFYFDPLVSAVHEAGGFITGFAGDACTALFPQTPHRNAATYALDAAHRMQRFLAGNSVYGTPHGDFPFSIRVGLSWGQVSWGSCGWCGCRGCSRRRGRARRGRCRIDRSSTSRAPPSTGAPPSSTAPARARCCSTRPSAGACPTPLPRTWTATSSAPARPASRCAGCRSRGSRPRRRGPRSSRRASRRSRRRASSATWPASSSPSARWATSPASSACSTSWRARYGGTFTGLDFGDKGTNSLIHFGAPVSHENDTERALDFTLELQRTAGRMTRLRAGVTRDVRYVGWNGGTRRQEFACLGRATNLAARLMMAAPWGEILCDPTIHADAGAHYQLDPRGALTFRGFEHPVSVHALGAKRAPFGQPRAFSAKELVGRGAELTRLLSSIAPIFSGRFAGLIYVDGEAGLGKSYLVQTARQRLEARFDVAVGVAPPAMPFLWIEAPCDQTLQRSLNAFEVALKEYFQQSPGGSREENAAHFEAALAALAARVPAGEEALRSEILGARSIYAALIGLRSPGSLYERLNPRDRFERTLSAIAAWVRAESRSRPVVLHVEDAHWADGDTLRAVQAIARLGRAGDTGPRLLQGLPIAVVCTARYTDDGGPFRIVLDAGIPVRNLGLVPLTADEISRLAENVGGRPIPDLFRAMLIDGAGGNPFFAEEIFAYWNDAELGMAEPSISSPSVALLPTDVNSLLVARLDRLPPRVKLTVLAAAVLGKEFDLSVLTAMAAGDPDVAEHVRVAEALRIFLPQGRGRYVFRNTLLRNAAYEIQARARLARLHLLAAQAIEAVHAGDLERHQASLGRHYRRAGLPDAARPWFLAAAREAASRYAHSETRRHYKSYFKLVTAPDVESATARYELARDVYEPRGDAGRALDEHASVIEEAQLLGDAGVEALGLLGLGRVTLSAAQPHEAAAHLHAAVAAARRAGNRWTEALALAHLALAHRAAGREADAEATFVEALTVGRAVGVPEGATIFGDMVAHDAVEHRPRETLGLYEQAMAYAGVTPAATGSTSG